MNFFAVSDELIQQFKIQLSHQLNMAFEHWKMKKCDFEKKKKKNAFKVGEVFPPICDVNSASIFLKFLPVIPTLMTNITSHK